MRIFIIIPVILLLVLVLPSCTGSDTSPGQTNQSTYASINEQDNLESTNLDNEQKSDLIKSMTDYIETNGICINSFIIMKDDQTLEEVYFDTSKKDTPMPVYSCTKSILSALVGIAIDEGKIKSVDEKITDLLDMDKYSLNDESKSGITLKNLLTMSSGLDPIWSNHFEYNENAIQYILDQPILSKAGDQFVYTNAGPHVISEIIHQATGMDTSEYAQQKLFDPLGIEKPHWDTDSGGLSLGGSGLYLTPRQLAVLGCLYLNEGEWEGKQIVPKEWVRESTGHVIDTATDLESEQFGYGYYWWQNGFGGYSARGYAGQYIFVMPEQNAVVVFTSTLNESAFMIPYQLMEKYVLPCLK